MSNIDWSDAPQFGRKEALQWTLERLHAKRTPDDRPLIVEVGTSYAYSLDGLGNATLAYAWYAQKYGARFASIDCWQGSIDEARRILDVYGTGQGTAEFMLADGQTAGEIVGEPIALMYEDGPDKDNHDTLGVNDSQNTWHLRVVERAMPLLPIGAMVLFDD